MVGSYCNVTDYSNMSDHWMPTQPVFIRQTSHQAQICPGPSPNEWLRYSTWGQTNMHLLLNEWNDALGAISYISCQCPFLAYVT